MRNLIVPLALLAMGVLLAAAVAIDCVRLAHDARNRVESADGQMVKYETSFVKQLEGNGKTTPEVQAAIDRLKSAHGHDERVAAWDSLVAAFRKTPPEKIDPTNPLDRKFMDETAGAMNRRDVAQKPYDAERSAYDAYMNSWRGRIARIFSSQGAEASK
jgi:hypothetical protein